jgi:hypothetical protein
LKQGANPFVIDQATPLTLILLCSLTFVMMTLTLISLRRMVRVIGMQQELLGHLLSQQSQRLSLGTSKRLRPQGQSYGAAAAEPIIEPAMLFLTPADLERLDSKEKEAFFAVHEADEDDEDVDEAAEKVFASSEMVQQKLAAFKAVVRAINDSVQQRKQA